MIQLLHKKLLNYRNKIGCIANVLLKNNSKCYLFQWASNKRKKTRSKYCSEHRNDKKMCGINRKGERHSIRIDERFEGVMEAQRCMITLDKQMDQYMQEYMAEHNPCF